MATEIVFKLEQNPDGFTQALAPDCKVKIKKTYGYLYLNYEKRESRIVGTYVNLRLEGENVLADVKLFDKYQSLESRFGYSIEGEIAKKNDKNEVEDIVVTGVGAIMDSKS